jgi:hypothetical protein
MRWHKEGIRDSEDANIILHPVDAEAWHALDHFDPEFARDPMSVHLDLSTNGFQPNSLSLLLHWWAWERNWIWTHGSVSRCVVDCVGSPFSQEQWDPSQSVDDS